MLTCNFLLYAATHRLPAVVIQITSGAELTSLSRYFLLETHAMPMQCIIYLFYWLDRPLIVINTRIDARTILCRGNWRIFEDLPWQDKLSGEVNQSLDFALRNSHAHLFSLAACGWRTGTRRWRWWWPCCCWTSSPASASPPSTRGSTTSSRWRSRTWSRSTRGRWVPCHRRVYFRYSFF